MKNKVFVALLVVVISYVITGLYAMDRYYFLCPIAYRGDIVIRNDNRGDGFFAARRGGGRRMHNGVDLLAEVGTPVVAARGGRVTSATASKGMGYYVIIQHPQGVSTVYGHLSAIYARQNSWVRQGELIGAVGKTGNANYRDMLPHLHLEVRKNSLPEDPFDYLE